jgi:hypothetical protein
MATVRDVVDELASDASKMLSSLCGPFVIVVDASVLARRSATTERRDNHARATSGGSCCTGTDRPRNHIGDS